MSRCNTESGDVFQKDKGEALSLARAIEQLRKANDKEKDFVEKRLFRLTTAVVYRMQKRWKK